MILEKALEREKIGKSGLSARRSRLERINPTCGPETNTW